MRPWKERAIYLTSVTDRTSDEKCYTIVHLWRGESGHLYFSFEHSDAMYCPIHNYYIENCVEDAPCRECPQAEFFIELPDGEVIPVRRLL